MFAVFPFFRKRPNLLILGIILLVGLFFRSYQAVERFDFAHDGDLYSWIAKDIAINRHLRLVGQETTAPGIFIGPAYYYLIIPFLLLTNMDPSGAIILITVIGILTVASYYFVFSKLFNIKIGLIASFLYAVLLNGVQLDRRVVPSTPTNIWVIWYFYTIVNILRGNYSVLPILGILIGLIWHIHIALLPALIAIPAALLISRKLPTKKEIFAFLIALLITSLPLIVFETRHNFQQTSNLLHNFVAKSDSFTGIYKFQSVLEMVTKNINTLFFMPQSFKITHNIIFVLAILTSGLFLVKRGILLSKEIIVFYIWIAGVIAFYSLSSSPISEYYFANIEIIFITIISMFLYLLFKSSLLGKIIFVGTLLLLFTKNAYFMVTQYYYDKGYNARKAATIYIKEDSKNKGYPCVGISYITTPGENVGFRYFFYLNNMHLVHPSLNVPVYNIIIPEELSQEKDKQKFGHIGVIPPTHIPPKESIEKSCQTPDTNLTDPMFGYVD